MMCQKKFDEADEELREAMILDPTLFEAPYYYARMLQMQGRFDEAAAYFERASALKEDDYEAAGLAHSIYSRLNRRDDMRRAATRSIEAAKRAVAVNPGDARALQYAALGSFKLGDIEGAKDYAARAVEIDPNEISTLYNVACLSSLIGDTDRAFELLNRAIDLGWSRPEWLKQDPDLVSVRDDPRYADLLKRLPQ
jgi:adenylate cyclase